MNQRIQELAKQTSAAFLTAQPDLPRYVPLDWQKFAQLIVHQMLAITDAHTEVFQTDRDRALIEHIKQSVKTHFGVEQ